MNRKYQTKLNHMNHQDTKGYPRQVDWQTYKFRCSQLGDLLPGPRAKDGKLQKTQESALLKIWMKEVWGFEKEISSKQMEKGNYSEQRGIDLVSRNLYGKFPYIKNEIKIENDYIIGTPDLIVGDKVHDIKCSYDLDTFMRAELTKSNEAQVMGYQWILGYDKGEIDKCLVSLPEALAQRVEHYLEKRLEREWEAEEKDPDSPECVAEYEATMRQFHLNTNFDRIPHSDRLKRFEVNLTDEFVETIKNNAPIWRDYLSKISI